MVKFRAPNAFYGTKKRQLWLLFALTVPSVLAWFTSLLPGLRHALWLTPLLIIVWPGALVGFEKEVECEKEGGSEKEGWNEMEGGSEKQ